MTETKDKPPRGLQLGGLVMLVVGVFVGVGFQEAAGTGVALTGIAVLWGSRLFAWWRDKRR